MESLLKKIEKMSGQNISSCYQCGKCTSGCPVAAFMDVPPHRINKLIIMEDERFLKNNSPWLCTACYTCGTRCPNDIDSSKVYDAVKIIINNEKIRIRDRKIKIFNKVFYDNIRKYGRVFELGMIVLLKLKTKDLFSDMVSGTKLFLKGKIGLKPHNIKDKKSWQKFLEK